MKQQDINHALAIPIWLVWIVALGMIFLGIGHFPILNNNEGLYAEIPREMLASHDWRHWIIPHLNGLPYMEKPPLLYWLTALSFALFGETEWAARLVSALSALACVAMLMAFGKAIKHPLAGRLAALIFISGIGVAAMSHLLMFDMLLTALLTAALMAMYLYLQQNGKRWIRFAYGFLALAVLAKGLVALILFGMIVTIDMLMAHRSVPAIKSACTSWFEPGALLIFLLIVLPWHIAASMVEPIFSWFYFVNEHVLRFLGQREPHDYYAGPWWYYLPRMVIYLFPWSFLLLGFLFKNRPSLAEDTKSLHRFLCVAWLVPLLFFSISSAKANYYLVAVMPFAALHLALALERHDFLRGGLSALPGVAIGAVMLLLCWVWAGRGASQLQTDWTIAHVDPYHFVLYVLFCGAVLAFLCAALAFGINRVGVLSYMALPAGLAIVLMLVLGAMEADLSTKPIVKFIHAELPDRKIYLYRNFEEQSSLPFYLKKVVPVIEMRSNDLFWGNRLVQNQIALSAERFQQQMQQQPVAVVVMDRQSRDFMATDFFYRFKDKQRIGHVTVYFN